MTQEQTELFELEISKVHNSISSIFSKEDVISMLTVMQKQFNELPKAQPELFTKQHILNALKEALDDFEYDEFVNCEPELHGCYGSSYSLEMNTSFDEHEFKRSLLTDLENYLTQTE